MRTNVPRSPEAVRPVDRGAEGERGDRADARHPHQAPADLLTAGEVENLLGEPGELVQHGSEDRKERLDERLRATSSPASSRTRPAKAARLGVPSLTCPHFKRSI